MFEIKITHHHNDQPEKVKQDVDDKRKKETNEEQPKPEKIETCYFCHQKFDINKDDYSHYKYGKFPMCAYCSEFYGFYSD
ncbi:MAG: hypothetical protein LLF83_08620 [Methanobacterium sp.]|nr:hypothetical protein [Methanobacterium sp.]